MHPREFGKYRIIKLLPLGGMGRVYLAVDGVTNRQVALKLIEQGPDRDRQDIVEAERRGAMLQERLCRTDSRIANIRSYGELDNFFYIEMDYVEGQDLSEVLARGPLGVRFAARIGRDLCEVLEAAHNFTAEIEGHGYRGVVHGDIKPRNIRITPDGEVRVLDFGIAKALSLTRTYTQNQFGSSQYSSPERLNTADVDFASDLWSVAVVLYECATGKPYFEAESGPRLDHLIRNYRTWRPIPPTLPEPFVAILRKALHPDPGIRYGSARDFASDLSSFLAGAKTAAESLPAIDPDTEQTRRTVLSETAAVEEDAQTRRTVPSRPSSPAPPWRPTVRERRVRVAAGLLLFVLVAGLFGNEWSVWRAGSALRNELEAEKLTDLNAAWTRYHALADRNYLPLVLSGTRKTILNRLTSFADRTILGYRNSEAPSISEGDWVRAQASLARALELDPGDETLRGKLYLCDGHISRIRGRKPPNSKLLNDARSKFDQARELWPKSPDPYLGLARLYIDSVKDVDKAQEALRGADKRGHQMGRREKAQLGDGYRDRAERLLQEADRSAGLPEEKDYLERARSDFQRAEELYRDIVPFAGSTGNLRRVLDFTFQVDERLKTIREGA